MNGRSKELLKDFFLRGFLAMGFGPIVLSLVYFFLFIFKVVETVNIISVILGIFTISLLAFIVAGMTVIYRVERLPLVFKILIHAFVLYLSYASIYLVNGWLGSDAMPFIIFSVSFAVGFALIWVIVYFRIRRNISELNREIAEKEE